MSTKLFILCFLVFIYQTNSIAQSPEIVRVNTSLAGFCDDFEDGNANGWTPLHPSSWTVLQEQGSFVYFITLEDNPANPDLVGEYSIFDGFASKDFTFECRGRSVDFAEETRPDMTLIYEYQDDANYSFVNFNKDFNFTNINKAVNNVRTILATSNGSVPVTQDANYHDLKVTRSGSQIQVFYDGTLVMSTTDPNPVSGKFGVGSKNDQAAFDSINLNNTCGNPSQQTFDRVTTGAIVNDITTAASSSWIDYDNDDDLDVFIANRGNQNNLLYRNNGNDTFTKVTSGDIVNDDGESFGHTWGDYDNDGDNDLFVTNKKQNKFLYKNNGNGTFTKITTGHIVNNLADSKCAAWGDYNNDGFIDLFVANDSGENNFLYRNNGDGTFQRITSGNIVNDGGISTSCTWGDIDNDGNLDLYVTNWGEPNFLYRNNGNETFTKITTGAIVNDVAHDFGASWGDFNNDGFLDLFVANDGSDIPQTPEGENDFLYRNNGNGTFQKITDAANYPMVDDEGHSYSTCWGDFDNDGDLDLFVSNKDTGQNDFLYRNDGPPNYTFTKITTGNIVTSGGDSFGSAWGDYNRDGFVDLFVANRDEPKFLYRNNGNSNNWININCQGSFSNRTAIGAKVRIKAQINGNAIWQLNEISSQTSGGLSGLNSFNAEFGLGNATIIDSIKIEWPSGIKQFLTNVPVNQFLEIVEETEPDISVNPNAHNFGSVTVGSSASKTFVVTNTGTADLIVNATTITGANMDQFNINSGGGAFTLAPGLSRNLVVSFNPTSTGSKTASLQISSNDPDENPSNISLSGTGVSAAVPDIVVNPTSHDYGPVTVGANASQTFFITNAGTADLLVSSTTLLGTNSNQFAITSGGGAFTLAPSLSRNIVVSFNPSSEGSKNATLQISSNDPDENPVNITLAGTGIATPVPDITVNTTFHDYGQITVGSSSSQTFSITNDGTADLVVNSTTLLGSDIDQFNISSGGGTFTIGPSLSRNVVVTFSPTSAGSKNVTFRISSNDPDENPLDVTLTGTGVATSVPDIVVNPTSHDFGGVTVGARASVRFFITNAGAATLEVSATALLGDDAEQFNITSGGAPFTLTSGNSSELEIEFNPTSTGTKFANLQISSNDPDEDPFPVILSGTGVEGPVPDIAVNASVHDYGSVSVNSSAIFTIRVSNEGTANLIVESSTLLGSDNSQFNIDSGGGAFTLAPSSSHDVLIRFAPTSEGFKNVSMQFVSNDQDPDENPLNVLLFGTGIIDITPPTLGTPTFSQTVNQNTEIPVSILVTDDTQINSVELSFRSGGSNYSTTPMNLQGNSIFTGTIPSAVVSSQGVDFFITAEDINNNRDSTGISGIQVTISSGITKAITRFGSERTAYQLFSVTLDLVDKNPLNVLDELGPYNDTKWRFFDLLPNQSYAELDETPSMRMNAGKAFWLIVKDAGKVINTGTGTSNKTSQEFAIPLNSGWTFVANPFNFSIPLSKVRMESGTNLDIRAFTSSEFTTFTGSLQPFDGYAVFSSGADRLMVNPILSNPPAGIAKAPAAEPNMIWSIAIRAEIQQARDTRNFAAVFADAAAGWDEHDRPEAPVIGEYVSVYFPHPEWGQVIASYATDARPLPRDGDIWEFEVKTNIRDVVQLTFLNLPGFQNLEGFVPEIWLVDEALTITQNLREQNHYAIASASETHPKRLKLLVGTPEFIGSQLEGSSLQPSDFELAQNFPNPFNPVTTIRFGLSKEERVTLKIYNLRGELVAILVENEPRAAGYHAEIWDGRDHLGQAVASGLYVYQLRAGGKTLTKKMALLK